MLREQSDKDKFQSLMESLKIWSLITHNTVFHKEFEKETGSLYRFGWFEINGYNYSISGWKFKDAVVTFECENTGEKIKYDIMGSSVLNKEFKRDSFITKNIKKLRTFVSVWLRKASDKLQP